MAFPSRDRGGVAGWRGGDDPCWVTFKLDGKVPLIYALQVLGVLVWFFNRFLAGFVIDLRETNHFSSFQEFGSIFGLFSTFTGPFLSLTLCTFIG